MRLFKKLYLLIIRFIFLKRIRDSSVILALIALSCCSRADGLNPNDEPVGRRSTTTTKPLRVDKIRDVEAIDPGLLSPSNATVTRSVTNTLGKQFSNSPGQFGSSFGGSSFGGSSFGGNSFPGGVGNNNLGPESVASQFTPGIGQTGSFVPTSHVAGFNQPGQIGGFPNNGIFPGGGILPGATQLPPGSVSPDTVINFNHRLLFTWNYFPIHFDWIEYSDVSGSAFSAAWFIPGRIQRRSGFRLYTCRNNPSSIRFYVNRRWLWLVSWSQRVCLLLSWAVFFYLQRLIISNQTNQVCPNLMSCCIDYINFI